VTCDVYFGVILQLNKVYNYEIIYSK